MSNFTGSLQIRGGNEVDIPNNLKLRQLYACLDSGKIFIGKDNVGGTLQLAVPPAGSVLIADIEPIATNKLLGRATAGVGGVELIDCTAAGRNLLDDADASAQRTTLGLGSIATHPTSDFDAAGLASAAQTAAIAVSCQRASNLSDVASVGTSRTNLGLGTVAILTSDTDGTLAANSDTSIATQKATKTYVDNRVTGLLNFKGSTDCSGNPNYPSAVKGDAYYVTTAGKIGGASGVSVDVGDVYVAKADNVGGTQASVGTSWFILEHNLVGALLSANNLSDLASASTARTNLGLGTLAIQSGAFSGTSSGTNTGDQTNITGNAATVTTNHNMTGPITGTGNVTSITSQTGTGTTFAMSASPQFSGNVGIGKSATYQLDVLGAIQSDTGFVTHVNGSDTIASSAYYSLFDAASNNAWLWQLSASNHLDWWSFNGAWTRSMRLQQSGSLALVVAGGGFLIKEGTNATMGVATLVAGTVTVSTTKVTASSRIFLEVQSLGTVAVATPVAITARSAGTSFTISSSSITDTSVIAWVILEPSS